MVRPESATIFYAERHVHGARDLFVPVQEQERDSLDVETEQPLEIEAIFIATFQLEWPAALGATYWIGARNSTRFILARSKGNFRRWWVRRRRRSRRLNFRLNYSERQESSFRLGPTAKGKSPG